MASAEGRSPSSARGAVASRREEVEQRPFDPRREVRRQLLRLTVPEDVNPRDLDQEVRQELRSLAKDTADLAAKHLVMTGRLLDDEPETALAHARAAGALAGRIGPVREAVGLAAYAAGEWSEALSELRTARRITGRAEHLAVIADCERALGRPERALAVLDDPDVPRLEQSARVELVIVVAGARRDLGQPEAAVLLLQGPARATTARRPWATRLWYAYADALLAAGREDESREWFAKAAEQDGQGETDAIERLLELDGVVLEDLQADDDDEDEAESEPIDLEALLSAPAPEGVAPGTELDADMTSEDAPDSALEAHADEPVREVAVSSGASDVHDGPDAVAGRTSPDLSAGTPEADAQPVAVVGQASPDLPAEASSAAAPDPVSPSAPHVGTDTVAGVTSTSLFSDQEQAHAAEPARLQVPAVRFAPPPDEPTATSDKEGEQAP